MFDHRSASAAAPGPLRWPVDLPAAIHERGSCALPVRIVDLGAAGCRIWAGFRLSPGRTATLKAGEFAPFDATILSIADWHAELRFRTPIHIAVLHHLAVRYPAPRRDHSGVTTSTAPSLP